MKAHLRPPFPPAVSIVYLALISIVIFLPILALAAMLAGFPYGFAP
jgi:hypothetical protein